MHAYPPVQSLIPHADAMCLLARVLESDEHRIRCEAHSHRDPDNPLRFSGRLSVQAGIEYAAQAMAAHGSLCARTRQADTRPQTGYLAVLSDVRWHADRLDDRADPLIVYADRLHDTPGGRGYRFRLNAGDTCLLEGEAIIALQDDAA